MGDVRTDTRTWTYEELRAAVASMSAWKNVASALNLSQSSTPRLKRHTPGGLSAYFGYQVGDASSLLAEVA